MGFPSFKKPSLPKPPSLPVPTPPLNINTGAQAVTPWGRADLAGDIFKKGLPALESVGKAAQGLAKDLKDLAAGALPSMTTLLLVGGGVVTVLVITR